MPGPLPAAPGAVLQGKGVCSRGLSPQRRPERNQGLLAELMLMALRLSEKFLLFILCFVNAVCYCSVPEIAAPSLGKLFRKKSFAGWNRMPTREGP